MNMESNKVAFAYIGRLIPLVFRSINFGTLRTFTIYKREA